MLEKAGKNSGDNRRDNRGLVLRMVATGACRTRRDLVVRTGLSKMTISNIVGEMIDGDVLRESEVVCSEEPGRNPVRLRLSPEAPKAAGVAFLPGRCESVLCGLDLRVFRRAGTDLPKDAPEAVRAGDRSQAVGQDAVRDGWCTGHRLGGGPALAARRGADVSLGIRASGSPGAVRPPGIPGGHLPERSAGGEPVRQGPELPGRAVCQPGGPGGQRGPQRRATVQGPGRTAPGAGPCHHLRRWPSLPVRRPWLPGAVRSFAGGAEKTVSSNGTGGFLRRFLPDNRQRGSQTGCSGRPWTFWLQGSPAP